jgi:anti-anti-sigma regulatory factor
LASGGTAWEHAPLSRLRIRIILNRGLALDLDGALTAANARRFERVVVDALPADGPAPPSLAIDLVRLTFVDEDGLAALVRASDLALAAGTSLVLREPSRTVRSAGACR